MSTVLSVEDLTVGVSTRNGHRTIVDRISLSIDAGTALGLVGESGSGKSMTARSVLGLFPPHAKVSGRIEVGGVSVLDNRKALRAARSGRAAMIFQDPRAHINAVHRIGDFMTEAMRRNLGMTRTAAEKRATDLLGEVGIPDGERRLRQYPHELSGGLLQRVMIATAIAIEPDLILADEPTTALDVTTQAEVMAILGELRAQRGLAMLFITHDLELAAATCDRTAVMYAGRIVEEQASSSLADAPQHPYTAGLLVARPSIDTAVRRLPVIPGRPLAAFEAGAGCAFASRCEHVVDVCGASAPPLTTTTAGKVACHRHAEILGPPPLRTPQEETADV